MDAYDVKIFQRRMNGAANVLLGVTFLAGTVILIIAILQQRWPWWHTGLSFCGITLFWSFIFYAISKSPIDTTR